VVGGGSTTYFWLDNWVGGASKHAIPLPFLIWPLIKGWRWGRWRGMGGGLEVRRGSGEGVCWRGKRILFWNVRPCCVILFCRMTLLIGGGGFLIPLTIILLRGHINILWCLTHLCRLVFFMLLGWNMFR